MFVNPEIRDNGNDDNDDKKDLIIVVVDSTVSVFRSVKTSHVIRTAKFFRSRNQRKLFRLFLSLYSSLSIYFFLFLSLMHIHTFS